MGRASGAASVPEADRFTSPLAFHGEGPFWDGHTGRLLFLDVLRGEVIAVDDLSGGMCRYRVPCTVTTMIRRRASGGFVIAIEHGLIGASNDLLAFEPIAELFDDPSCRTNDGGCDPLGGLVIGSMGYDERPGGGTLYRVAPNHEVTELLPSVSISNGVQWSGDCQHVYYVDTPTRRIDRFDFDGQTAAWSDRRVHIRADEAAGLPDGMAIDEDDGLWVAMWGGGTVNHYDADGDLLETIRVPGVSQVSSCAFGGQNRDVLFITTSRQGLLSGQEPDAGAIFAMQTNFRGVIPWEFGG